MAEVAGKGVWNLSCTGLAIAEDDISQATMDRILEATGSRESLRTELLSLKGRGLLEIALDRLEAYKEQIPLERAENFITGLFDACDELTHARRGMLELSSLMHADRIVFWYLRREPQAERRLRVLETAIESTNGISLPVDFVALESSKEQDERGRERTRVDEEGVRKLQQLCVAKIEAEAKSGRLAELPDMPSILYRWKEWAGEADPKQFAQDLVSTGTGAITFLKAFLSRSTSHGLDDYVVCEHWYIRLKSIEDFVPWERIEQVTTAIAPESLPTEEERRALLEFRRAVERRRAGKRDFGEGFNAGGDD